jgi:hypothetical protein
MSLRKFKLLHVTVRRFPKNFMTQGYHCFGQVFTGTVLIASRGYIAELVAVIKCCTVTSEDLLKVLLRLQTYPETQAPNT